MISQMITNLFEKSQRHIDEVNAEEMDDSTDILIVSASSALKSLENVRWFLLQQENTNEQIIIRQLNSLERFVSGRKSSSSQMKQTTINQYFN